MKNNIISETAPAVGIVKEIHGDFVIARLYNNTNNLTYYYNGVTYRGVGIGEYIGIKRGPYKLVGRVTKEYLQDADKDFKNQAFRPDRFIREINISIVGAFRNGKFDFGISVFPKIFSEISLLSSEEIVQIITGNTNSISEYSIVVGKTVPEGLTYSLDWTHFFNTHFAIFGNTGSGKSNTLTKLYTSLFNKNLNLKNSRFVFIDFNGEYTGNDVLTKDKKVIKLDTSTRKNEGLDEDTKIILSKKEFWDSELLSVLFSATKQTQEPFLRSTLNYYKPEEGLDTEKLFDHVVTAFKQTFLTSYQDSRTLNLLNTVLDKLCNCECKKTNAKNEHPNIDNWLHASFNSTTNTYYVHDYKSDNIIYANNITDYKKIISDFKAYIKECITDISKCPSLTILSAFLNLEMIYKLSYDNTQFDYIHTFLERVDSKANMFDKILSVGDSSKVNLDKRSCLVVSLRNVNRDMKEIIPLLLTRHFYRVQKNKLKDGEFIGTTNLIIDEAHNILSAKTKNEGEQWRDYRLDVFEEIIKEGRKFYFYLTIASQRPADISETIVSQMHNFIIHRLVNENDLKMLGNSLNSLDSVSKAAIPTLGPGMAIFTGTSFPLPVTVQVDKLSDKLQPDSQNADLAKIWGKQEVQENHPVR